MAGFTEEDKAVLAQFGDPDEGVEDEPTEEPEAPEGEPAPDPEGEQEPPVTEEPPAPTTVRIGDRDVALEDLQALIEFQEWTSQNPEKMAAFGQYIRGEAEFVVRQEREAPAPTPEPQVDWDLVDPGLKQIYETQQAQLKEVTERLEGLQNPITAWQTQQAQEANRKAAEDIARATEIINEKFSLELSDEEVDKLHQVTAQLQILPGLRQTIADPVEAVATALETAVWRTPEFRDKIVSSQVASARASERANDKRTLAGTIGGTSGSERSGVASGPSAGETKNLSKEERNAAMAAEIAEWQRGTT